MDDYQVERKNNGNLVIFCWRCHKEWFTNKNYESSVNLAKRLYRFE